MLNCMNACLCECMRGLYKYHSNSIIRVSKTYFTVKIWPPSENSSPQLVSQAGYELASVTL